MGSEKAGEKDLRLKMMDISVRIVYYYYKPLGPAHPVLDERWFPSSRISNSFVSCRHFPEPHAPWMNPNPIQLLDKSKKAKTLYIKPTG